MGPYFDRERDLGWNGPRVGKKQLKVQKWLYYASCGRFRRKEIAYFLEWGSFYSEIEKNLLFVVYGSRVKLLIDTDALSLFNFLNWVGPR